MCDFYMLTFPHFYFWKCPGNRKRNHNKQKIVQDPWNAAQSCYCLFLFFYSLFFWGPTTQIPNLTHTETFLNSKYPALLWLVSSHLFVNYSIYLLPLFFLTFLLLCDWLWGLVTGIKHPPLFVLLFLHLSFAISFPPRFLLISSNLFFLLPCINKSPS